jgi:tripartite-type tricarboxylate transporter receptor subunit TctC
MSFRTVFSAAALAVSAALALPATAGTADFYAGRTITFVTGSGPGGTYGVYAQTFAPFLKKHLPGNPAVVVQFDPAGGGRHAAAYVSNAAPKDGTVICMTQQNVPIFHVLGAKGISFDVTKWQWIGKFASVGSVMGVWHTAPATTLADMQKKQIVVGATGRGSETYMNPTLAAGLLGAKLKIVTGYRGSRPLFKAIEQGEIHAFALSYESFKALHGDWIRDRKIVFAMQTGLESEPDIRDVPLMWQLARNPLDRAAMKLVASASKFGRSVWAPAGVPEERVAALRAAFNKVVKDRDFIAAVARRNLPFEPAAAAEVENLTRELFATDRKAVAHARKALGL